MRNALNSQLAFVAQYCTDIVANGYTDSGYDYFGAALDIANALLSADYDGVGPELAKLANDIGYIGDSAPADVIGFFASLPGVKL